MLVLKFLDKLNIYLIKCCWCSVAKSCLTLCDPIDCSTPGFPIPHRLPEFVKFMLIELMMLSNYLSLCSPLPSVFNLSQHQGLFQWVNCSHQVSKGSFTFNNSLSNEYSGIEFWSPALKTAFFTVLATREAPWSLVPWNFSLKNWALKIGLKWPLCDQNIIS